MFASICLRVFLAALAALPLLAGAHDDDAGGGGSPASWAGPAISGSWYDPARDGEGFIVEMLPDGSIIAAWFTYPAAGEAAEQAWLIAAGGRIVDNRVVFEQVYQTSGGVFGPGFDPAQIQRVTWGSLELTFHSCSSATARYTGPAAYGSGERALQRLTSLNQLDCHGNRALTASGARALAGLRVSSGPWFVSSRSGEGWFFEELAGGATVVYWFTFSPQGRPVWMVGAGVRAGNRLVIDNAIITGGTRFGSGFDPAAVQRRTWGRMEFTFSGCNSAEFVYSSALPGYGSGAHPAVRLSALASAPCIDGTPQPRTTGSWREEPGMPAPNQSEHAVTMLDGKLYALGGFGDPRGFKRFDPATASWSRLADLPSGRNHLAAFAIGGAVYYTGGEGANPTPGYRYDVAANRWDAVTELQPTYGSHAAILNGHAYIGRPDGSLQQFSPNDRHSRIIPAIANTAERDHSQVVAFLGEIWLIGGRSPETRSVAIFDPVSEQWRLGPPMARGRGGFAAAVVDDQIVIGGGEVLLGGVRIEPTVEIYTAGGDAWRFGPVLAQPVHGVAAGAVGNRWYVVSGSNVAGAAVGATGRMFSIQLLP